MGIFDLFTSNPPKKSTRSCKSALEQAVDNNRRGMSCEKSGNIDKAITYYEKNVTNRFEGNRPYDRLAIIYRKRKDYDNEVRVLETAIDVFKNINSGRQDAAPKLAKFKTRLSKAKELQNKQ